MATGLDTKGENILRSLRKITRAIDLHSKKLAAEYKLTAPQLVCLRQLARQGPQPPSRLAREISLSQATLTGIVDRLEKRGIVQRRRDQADRRAVSIHLTGKGKELIEKAPTPLQQRFATELTKLSPEQQEEIQAVLDRIVHMMGADGLDAAPVIATGNLEAAHSEVKEFLSTEEQASNKK